MTLSINTNSTLFEMTRGRRQAADLSRQLDSASREVATGLTADAYKTLGARSAETVALRGRMDRNDGFIQANTVLSNRLGNTALTMSQIRETAQGFLELAVANRDASVGTASDLQAAAQTAIEQLRTQMNITYNSAALFSGIESGKLPLQPWNEANPATGLAPADAVAGVIGGGVTDPADAAAKIAQMQAIFTSDPAAGPAGFESTFYNGAPALAADGSPNERLETRIEEGVSISHGIQANDPAFQKLFQGLAMFAGTDVSTITDPEAFELWIGEAVTALSDGVSGMLAAESRLGGQQQALEQTITSQQDRRDLYNSQILALEGVDPYEAASRVSMLQTQLEATYAITSRLANLSFLNYM